MRISDWSSDVFSSDLLSLSHDAGPRMTGAHYGIQDNPSVEGRRCRCALHWNAPPVRLDGSLDPTAPAAPLPLEPEIAGIAGHRDRGVEAVVRDGLIGHHAQRHDAGPAREIVIRLVGLRRAGAELGGNLLPRAGEARGGRRGA